jgi:hypothetical protein
MNPKSKLVLKKIVRECLLEILSEGFGNELLESKKVTKNIKKPKLKQKRNFNNKLNEAITTITDDSLMQSILMDTAKNTLQEQLKHEKHNFGQALNQEEIASETNSGIDLNGVFKEASNNWSAMAFGNKKNM